MTPGGAPDEDMTLGGAHDGDMTRASFDTEMQDGTCEGAEAQDSG